MGKIVNQEALRQFRMRRGKMDLEWEKLRDDCQAIKDVILPKRGRQLHDERNDNEQNQTPNTDQIFDSLATDLMNILVAGLMSGLYTRSRPWFRLGVADPDLNDQHDVREYFDVVTRRMRDVLDQSNFYTEAHSGFYELSGFGTAPMLVLEDEENVIHCRQMTVGEYRLAQDQKGQIDTLYRRFQMTSAQLIQEFGEDAVSTSVKENFKNGRLEESFQIEHVIEPNDDRMDFPGLPKSRGWRSVYYEVGTQNQDSFLDIRFFDDWPAVIPRWDVTSGDVYGMSPAMNVLPDVKMLQALKEKLLIGVDLAVDPAMQGPADIKEIDMSPRGYNPNDSETLITPIERPGPDIQTAQFMIEETKQNIRAGLFTDMFLMLAGSTGAHMTATEVLERREEKMLMLGPMVNRFHVESADPLITRVFNIMGRIGLLPDAPESLQGREIKVEYISQLAQAARAIEAPNIEMVAGFVGRLSAVDPAVLDKFDSDQAVDEYSQAIGGSPRIIRSDEEVLAMREARAQQQAAAQAMAMAQQGAATAKVMAETPVGEASALEQMIGV